MNERTLETRIGVGVLVIRDGRVLLGVRRNSHGHGEWAPPGGHLEANETVTECAARELFEETGLTVQSSRAGPYSVNDFPEIGRRYVTLMIITTDFGGTLSAREPDKCPEWVWVPWRALATWSEPLFAPLASIVASGFTPD